MKGMVRNVLEILSFSKIQIDEEKHAQPLLVRDMRNRNRLVGSATGCGFLVKKGKDYVIEDCGETKKISHQELKKEFPRIESYSTGKEKYEAYGFDKAKEKNYVFTGKIARKSHEFIFRLNGKEKSIKNTVFENFKTVYFDNESSVDGRYWKDKFDKNIEVPVFYQEKNNSIVAMGLTQLFKLCYSKTILQAARQSGFDEGHLDLAETIFGTQNLRGRVQFGHLKSTNIKFESKVNELVLAEPKPSYYPNYIRQTNVKGDKVESYKTLMDNDAKISGWKRYPLQQDINSSSLSSSENIKTEFKPLPKGTVFKGKVRIHNLKKVEIGALLSALTFHGQSKECMHNIGMAKPYGYGKVDIKLSLKDFKYSIDDYLKEFEETMSSEIAGWRSSLQLREFFAMASVNCKSNLRYQKLEERSNEFDGDKKNKKYLLLHSGKVNTSNETSGHKGQPNAKSHKIPKKENNALNLSNLFGGNAMVRK